MSISHVLADVSTRWLSDKEKAIAVYRLERDTGVKDEETMSLLQSFKAAVVDYKLWLLALIIVTKTTAGAVTQFIPTVVATFGMSKVQTYVPLRARPANVQPLADRPAIPLCRRPCRCHLAHIRQASRALLPLARADCLWYDWLYHRHYHKDRRAPLLFPVLDGRRHVWVVQCRPRLDFVHLPSSSRQARRCLCHHQLAWQWYV